MRSVLSALLLLVIPVFGAPQQPLTSADKASVAGKQVEDATVVNGVYSNECLGFSFAIPDSWEIPNRVGDSARASHIPGGLGLLLIRQQSVESNVIWLLARENATFNGNTEQLVSKLVKDYVDASPETRTVLGDVRSVKYGGQQFFRRDYQRSLQSGDTSYMAFIVTNFRGFFIGGSLRARSLDELNRVADMFRGISFREDRADVNCSMAPTDAPGRDGVIRGIISSKPILGPPGWAPIRVRVSQKVSQAFLIEKVDPQYPPEARQKHVEGMVVLTGVIDYRGNVQQLTLVSGDPLLAAASIAAVSKWKYRPYLLNGEPTDVETQISVNFALDQH